MPLVSLDDRLSNMWGRPRNTYLSATLYIWPSFSSSAITQSVMQGVPATRDMTVQKDTVRGHNSTDCEGSAYTMPSAIQLQKGQDDFHHDVTRQQHETPKHNAPQGDKAVVSAGSSRGLLRANNHW